MRQKSRDPSDRRYTIFLVRYYIPTSEQFPASSLRRSWPAALISYTQAKESSPRDGGDGIDLFLLQPALGQVSQNQLQPPNNHMVIISTE